MFSAGSGGLNSLLNEIGESIEDIEADPNAAYARLCARKRVRAISMDCDLEEVENTLSPQVLLPYGHRVIGNLLLSQQRVVTRQDMNDLWESLSTYRSR